MRKFICIFLSIAMVFTCMIFSSSAQSTDNVQLQPMPTDTSLYISTEACPDAYITYVNQNVHRFIDSVSFTELTPGDTLTVGAPFAFSNEGSDIYYFPILRGSEILYTFRVFPVGDGEYSGILGRSFVDELNALAATTSAATPLRMVMEGDTVAAYVGNTRSVIFEYPDGTIQNDTVAATATTVVSNSHIVVEATKTNADISYQYTVPNASVSGVIDPNTYMRYLDINIGYEVQGGNQWCCAYVTAIILRYVLRPGDLTDATEIMEYFYGSGLTVDKKLSRDEAIEYANTKGVYPTQYNGTLSISALINEIDHDRPVYYAMQCDNEVCKESEDDSGHAHAFCLYGYHLNYQTWGIWNPWESEGETLPWGGEYAVANSTHCSYAYYGTIYNWE